MPDYSKFDKDQLVKIIKRQDKELKTKKYGLVWDSEREPEQVVLDCENNLPILKRIKSKEIRTDDSKDNILIEGDNYHALTVLNYTHKEKIDIIYIDPPYNIGNKDFIYNDRYVEKEDGYRHSKWLNFMEKRLNLAKELLKMNGVIFISINDIEQAQIKLLCNKIFGEDNFLANIVWQNKEGGGSSDSKHFRIKHEYILGYTKNKRFCEITGDEISNLDRYKQKDQYFKTRGPFYLQKLGMGSIQYSPALDYQIETPDRSHVIPSDNNKGKRACWRWSKQKLDWGIKNNFIVFKKDKNNIWQVYTKQYLNCDNKGNLIERQQRPFGVIDNYSSTQGAKELREMEIINFTYPKPKDLICYLLSKHPDESAIILDFMAGSGTTGHAVLQLNKEDSGNRKFILCTNNENNICTEATYPRIQKVIKGYKKNGNGEHVKGLSSNLQYLKTGFVKKTKNRDQVKINLTRKCTEMLCVKENIFNLEMEEKDYKIFSSNKKVQFLCIYYNFIDDTFDDFLVEIKRLKGKKIIYMFSMENIVEKSLFVGIKNIKIEAIPQNILDVYKKLVKMNIPVKINVILTDLKKAKTKIFANKDKDDGARVLRVVLEKVIQKISQDNRINILNAKGKEEKISKLNDSLFNMNIITKVEWTENKIYLAIGNYAAHGEYGEYDLKQVEKFYKHIRSLLNSCNV